MKNQPTVLTVSFALCIFMLFGLSNISNAKYYTFENVINGAQEVPAVVTGGSGTIKGTYNDVTNLISYNIIFFGLTGTTSAGHFHGPALAGVNAGVQIGYAGFPLSVTNGTYTSTSTLTAAQETQLIGGMWYANIHTSFKPGGEIRGQINMLPVSLNLATLIEGLLVTIDNNNGGHFTLRDTLKVYLRNSTSPYAVADSAKVYFSNSGNSNPVFDNVNPSLSYYIQINHRNSIDTWSKSPVSLLYGSILYNFILAANKAFGDNLKNVYGCYCLYSGDTNKDAIIDASDLSDIDNNLDVTGYVKQDLNGDDYVDASDLNICDNNQSVQSATP